jgi:D-alanine-D-alanine ligase
MQKNKVVLFMGGDSGEYEVSIASAAQVKNHLDPDKFEVYPVLIRDGNWTYTDKNGVIIPFDRNQHSIFIDGGYVKFDCAFIAIHGTPGEDGKLQGYLEMAGIPYTTCDVTTSALTFNKYFCNDLAIQYGVKVARTIIIRHGETRTPQELVKEVGLPCFVKPNKSGSSVGVSKVYTLDGIQIAIEKAVQVLPVTEVISKNDFFDYQAKYTEGLASEITPAPITEEQSAECKRLTDYLYRKFNCKGVVRFDYFLTGDEWWFLEVNTVPGFSAESIIPKQARAAGFELKEFFGDLVEEAIRKK